MNTGIREVRKEDPPEDLDSKIKKYKLKSRKTIILVVAFIVLMALGVYLAIRYQSYRAANVLKVYETADLSDSICVQYGKGIVTCSGDGVIYLDQKGQEIWNQPCQIKKPVVEICQKTVIVGDKGGSDILVFQEDGLKGEIHTSRPIEKLSVSAQGIVAAVLTDETAPLVICYDAMGNVLVEHQTSLMNTGYPIDISLSDDGNMLLVSYLMVEGNSVKTRVVYYYFGEFDEKKTDYVVHQSEFSDTIVPTVAFLNKERSVLVSDQGLYFNEGLEKQETLAGIMLTEKIEAVAYGENRIATIQEAEQDGYLLRVYNAKGKTVMTLQIANKYNNLKVVDKHIIMYEDNKCAIYTEAGVCKYEGEISMNIKEIFPIAGLNKYMVISTGGLHEIQLVK